MDGCKGRWIGGWVGRQGSLLDGWTRTDEQTGMLSSDPPDDSMSVYCEIYCDPPLYWQQSMPVYCEIYCDPPVNMLRPAAILAAEGGPGRTNRRARGRPGNDSRAIML